MHVHAHACTHPRVHALAHTHACMHTRTHMHTCQHTDTHMRAHTHTHAYACTRTRTHTRTCRHMYTRAHTYTCACTHTYTCTHIHMHTCTLKHVHARTRTCTHAHVFGRFIASEVKQLTQEGTALFKIQMQSDSQRQQNIHPILVQQQQYPMPFTSHKAAAPFNNRNYPGLLPPIQQYALITKSTIRSFI